jgi:hypothetical protein
MLKEVQTPSDSVSDTRVISPEQFFRAADRQIRDGLIHSPDRAALSSIGTYSNTRVRAGLGKDIPPRLETMFLDNPMGNYERIRVLFSMVTSLNYIIDRVQADEKDGINRILAQYPKLLGEESIDDGSGRDRVAINSMQAALDGKDATLINGLDEYVPAREQMVELLKFMHIEGNRIRGRRPVEEKTPLDSFGEEDMKTVLNWFEPIDPNSSLDDFYTPGSPGIPADYLQAFVSQREHAGHTKGQTIRLQNRERIESFRRHEQKLAKERKFRKITKQATLLGRAATNGRLM